MKESTNCIVCDTKIGKYRVDLKNNYSIVFCSNCGLQYTLPIPSEEDLINFYHTYSDIRASSEVNKLNSSYKLKYLENNGFKKNFHNILDFGAGDGVFFESIDCDDKVAVDYARKFPGCHSDLNEVGEINFDFITMWGVLEHLHNPIEVMHKITNRLKKDGKIILTTIDTEALIPFHYKPIEHLTYWNKSSLLHLAHKLKLTLEDFRPYYMYQKKEIFINRILARIPSNYSQPFLDIIPKLDDFVFIPTNEFIATLGK